MLLFEQEKNS